MKKSYFVKQIISSLTVFVAVLFLLPNLLSKTAILADSDVAQSRQDIPYDTFLADQEMNRYASYDCLAIVRLTSTSGSNYTSSQEWLKGFYYYSIAKLGFADIPFHYVVTWDGSVYEGKGGGNDVLVPINSDQSSLSNKCIVVAYFDNNREITNGGRQSLKTISSEILNKYNLRSIDIEPADVEIQPRQEENLNSIVLNKSLDEGWISEIRSMSSSMPMQPMAREYSASIKEVKYSKTADAGKNFVVTVTVENESKFPWYNLGDYQVLLATSDPRGHDSRFFVNGKWASFSRVGSIEESWLLPGDTTAIEFEMATPLLPGNYKESFELLVLSDYWVKGSQFTVEFSVEAGDLDLVEILPTETGSLNVRECPSTGCRDIGQVVPGEVYVKLGQEGNWYKIAFRDGKEGWIFGKYVKNI